MVVEWILIAALTIAGGAGWFFAVTGLKIEQTQTVTTTQVQSMGAVTIVEGGQSRGVRWVSTNVADCSGVVYGLEDWQLYRSRVMPMREGWLIIYPEPVNYAVTNSRTITRTNN